MRSVPHIADGGLVEAIAESLPLVIVRRFESTASPAREDGLLLSLIGRVVIGHTPSELTNFWVFILDQAGQVRILSHGSRIEA